jgi:hypothetical protein
MIHSGNHLSGKTNALGRGSFLWRISPAILPLLLLLACPGIGRAEEPAPQKPLPAAMGEPITLQAKSGQPAGGESVPAGEGMKRHKRLLLIPYPLYNETIGAGVGVGVIGQGYLQPKSAFVGTVLVGSGSYLVYFKGVNYQFPWIKRIIFEPDFEFGKYNDVDTYTGTDNPGYPGQRAGSNDSDENNYIESDVSDQWVNLLTKFVLPIGQGRGNVIPNVVLDRGLFVSGDTGGDIWNPLESGRTYIEVMPFERRQSLIDNNSHTKTAGVEIGLRYDNTDFRVNPSKGSMQRVWFTRDWGALDSTAPYSVVGGEFSKYFSLGPSEHARQRTIAFDLWTVDCLTWNDSSTIDGTLEFHRPPPYNGASLGGLKRLRGYPATRFNDKAGILYTLEYRYLLNWNPLENVHWGGKLDVSWFEIVGFGELGRVAPSYNLSTLHESMKYDGGVGIRAMVNNIVVRIDFAAGDEGFATQMFVGHPFPFF